MAVNPFLLPVCLFFLLKAGLHAFQVDFADARSNPWQQSGIWRYHPRSWAIYHGNPTDILITGPGLDPIRIPKERCHHVASQSNSPSSK